MPRILTQLVHAVYHLHTCGIAHRDIKPQNILLDEANNVKLADFGFAVSSEDFDLSTCLGTPAYMAPELIKRELYGKPVDIWAIGVIVH